MSGYLFPDLPPNITALIEGTIIGSFFLKALQMAITYLLKSDGTYAERHDNS